MAAEGATSHPAGGKCLKEGQRGWVKASQSHLFKNIIPIFLVTFPSFISFLYDYLSTTLLASLHLLGSSSCSLTWECQIKGT